MSDAPLASSFKRHPLSVGVISRGDHGFQEWLSSHLELMKSSTDVQWLFATQSDIWKKNFDGLHQLQKTAHCSFVESPHSSVNEMRLVLLQHSQAEVHLFLDDDVWLEPQSLKKIRQLHNDHPYACAIGGHYKTPSQLVAPMAAYNSFCNLWIDLSLIHHEQVQLPSDCLLSSRNLLGGNWSVKKSKMKTFEYRSKSRLEGDERELFILMGLTLYFHPAHDLPHRPKKNMSRITAQVFRQALAKSDLSQNTEQKAEHLRTTARMKTVAASILGLKSLKTLVALIALFLVHGCGCLWSVLRAGPRH